MLMTPEVNGARQELPCLDSPEVNGARQEIASVKKYVNSAWQEVWANMKYLRYITDNLSDSNIEVGESLSIISESNDAGNIHFLSDEGEFVNPTISFDYYGSGWTFPEAGQGTPFKAGYISVLCVKSDGSKYHYATQYLGSTSGDTGDTVEITLSGTYTQLGFYISLYSQSGYVIKEAEIYNVVIDGKEYEFKA